MSSPVVADSGLIWRSRDVTPRPRNLIEKRKAEAKRDYDELIAMGGRPTSSIRPFLIWKTTARDGMFISSSEDNREKFKDVREIQSMDTEEDCLAAIHWCNEADRCREELKEWKRFKEAQRIHNQSGRSKLELELENTDVDLVEVLSKLNDWQEFEWIQQTKVYEAEEYQEECQQVVAKLQNARVGASGVESAWSYWMERIKDGQERLEASKENLMWVKGQWPDVLAEASQLIAAASPELQRQLENKFEVRTNATYRRLQLFRAKPSHGIRPPSENAGLAQRLDHWIFESLGFEAELRDWKFFLNWRRRFKGAETSQVDPRPKLFEDLVKYRQYKLDRATSWVNCWRHRARQLTKAKKRENRVLLPVDDEDDDEDDEDDEFDEDFQGWPDAVAYGFEEAEQAEIFASEGEEAVSIAEKRLEQSKQELEVVLAGCGRTSTGGNRKSSHNSKKGHRRSKKKELRRKGANTGNINTEQQVLPAFSPDPNQVNEDDDVEMSDGPENSRPVQAIKEVKGKEMEEEEIGDTVMADIEDHKPITKTISKKMPSPSIKTGSAAKLNQPLSGRIPKNKNKDNKKPGKKIKTFTEQQTMLLLNAASTSCPSTDPTVSLDAGLTSNPPTGPTASLDAALTSNPPTDPTASLDAALTSNPPSDATPLESIPLRRSERLKKKTTNSVAIASPHRSLNAVESSRVSKLKKGKMRADAVGL